MADIDSVRDFYAKLVTSGRAGDPRLERAFALVPREAFAGPGPWRILAEGGYVDTPDDDPRWLYQNVLVALHEADGINNGEPTLHARWTAAVAPCGGETVTHVGAGTGYYTAILSLLVLPGGQVGAFEIDAKLAAAATRNLEAFENTSVIAGDATRAVLPPSDVIYVNAGVLAPPVGWLDALRIGGRMIFPWRPSRTVGLAVVVTRRPCGLAVEPLAPAWFIPCVGASEDCGPGPAPDHAAAWRTRSLHLVRDRAPDRTATAVYRDVWFSETPLAR